MTRFLWFVFSFVCIATWRDPALAQAQKPSDSPVFLSGGTLVDVIRGEVYPDVGVLAQGGKITELFFDFPYNSARIPANAVRVDLKGKYIMPGMMDLHVHAQTNFKGVKVDLPHYMKIFMAGGVTTIRAMGSAEDNLVPLKHAIDTGAVAGPNLIIGSFPPIEQAPGFPRVERTEMVNTAIEARALTRDHIFKGAEWVKFYNYIDRDIGAAVVDEAHKHGAKVFGHFTMLGADDAAKIGVDSLEHTVSLIQKSLAYEDQIAMTDIGYYRYFVQWTKVNEKALDETFKTMIAHKTALIPTLMIQYVGADPDYLTKVSGEWFDLYQKDLFAAYQKDPLRVPAVYNFKAYGPQWKQSILAQARQVARFVKMGGRVGTGSDLSPAPPLVPGLSIRQELELFVAGGMTPLEALRSATIVPAEILGWEDRFGSIEIGKQADIVVLNANPLADIKAVGNIDSVMVAGRVYRINELTAELRKAP
ncbi:MAG: amidohydrolase family protein [Proteobacteria bacterium]|nr:amidohydrolase family protein [Pseudomonadota bacterium]